MKTVGKYMKEAVPAPEELLASGEDSKSKNTIK